MHLQRSSITYSAYLEQVQVFAPNRVEQGQLKSRVCHISVWDILTCSSYSPSQTGWAAPPSLHERLTQAMHINPKEDPWAGSPWGGITCLWPEALVQVPASCPSLTLYLSTTILPSLPSSCAAWSQLPDLRLVTPLGYVGATLWGQILTVWLSERNFHFLLLFFLAL